MKKIFILFLSLIAGSAMAQPSSYTDLVFENTDSLKSYVPERGKHYVYVMPSASTEEVAKNSRLDSISGFRILKIVLAYPETADKENAETADQVQQRWDNLMSSYYVYFKAPDTKFKNVYLTERAGQGFYIYYDGGKGKPVKETAAKEEKEEKKKKEKVVKEEEKPKETEKKTKEKEKKDETAKHSDEVKHSGSGDTKPAVVKAAPHFDKPMRAKDPKACRLPCYGGGDEDLMAFFKDNITLSKKQSRHGKDLVSMVKIQLNFDGTIKKTFVTGANEHLNKQVEEAINMMNPWNPAVKGGITVKSEIKMTLKYDYDTHAMRPSDTVITPRLGAQCKCIPDEEMFDLKTD